MKEILFTFRSVTPAQQAERILHRGGVRCRLARTPRQLQEQGCGYSLRLNQTEGPRAAHLLRTEGIPFRKVYLLSDNGGIQELEL